MMSPNLLLRMLTSLPTRHLLAHMRIGPVAALVSSTAAGIGFWYSRNNGLQQKNAPIICRRPGPLG